MRRPRGVNNAMLICASIVLSSLMAFMTFRHLVHSRPHFCRRLKAALLKPLSGSVGFATKTRPNTNYSRRYRRAWDPLNARPTRADMVRPTGDHAGRFSVAGAVTSVVLLLCHATTLAKQQKSGAFVARPYTSSPDTAETSANFVPDPNSRSNPNEAVTTHFHWRASVDFDKKVINAVVRYEVARQPGARNIVFDASPDLKVHSVSDAEGNPLEFAHLPEDMFGVPLSVTLPKNDGNVKIVISYSTSPSAGGLQWLEPAQTLRKSQPFMYSQNQAIFARTMIPCQDTPQVKMTFSADVDVPDGLVALMGARRVPLRQPRHNVTEYSTSVGGIDKQMLPKPTKMFRFRQDVPIPSYLIAIAVGDLKSRRIGRISELWAEEEWLEKAAYDFGDIDRMLDAAEAIVGPYRFGIYDILVLPPSFPYGGMENPCLTFVTSTLLTGDRSLASVVIHELAHSWFGDLVTTKTNEHFWLNEGFTVFLERKIDGTLFGEEKRRFSAKIGYVELREYVENFGDRKTTKLVTNLTNTNPADVFSRVPYEKGHTFLWYLEEIVGGAERMNAFLRSYVNEFAFRAVDSDDMKRSFLTFFNDTKAVRSVDWDSWFYGDGLPSYVPNFNTTAETQVNLLLEKWRNITRDDLELVSSADVENFTPQQKIAFLTSVNAEKMRLTDNALEKMSAKYKFNTSSNSEILAAWLIAALRNRYEPALEPAKDFVRRVGRMKFLFPIFDELLLWTEKRNEVEQLYDEIRPGLMEVSRRTLDGPLTPRNRGVR
ncbi:Leukotriene A-4 hydrolase-like [Tropilaelaps mercedesae]|uniref:Leukotriene A-4 hydrolase-like n=1 Tax=Tropilaelaps mercedesae TaxID=418985 RepID=A0A1V9XDF3_9ACAR|nr:Leukotriene A-4 hydrolase-like [Tropilaelaps mercedesae]